MSRCTVKPALVRADLPSAVKMDIVRTSTVLGQGCFVWRNSHVPKRVGATHSRCRRNSPGMTGTRASDRAYTPATIPVSCGASFSKIPHGQRGEVEYLHKRTLVLGM